MGVVEGDMGALGPHRPYLVEQRVGPERVFGIGRGRRPQMRGLCAPSPLRNRPAIAPDNRAGRSSRCRPRAHNRSRRGRPPRIAAAGPRACRAATRDCRPQAKRGTGPWRCLRSSATVMMSCIWKWSSRKPSTGPGPAAGEELLEPGLVEPRRAGLAAIDAREEDHLAILGEQLDHLVIHAHVDIIAVGVVEPADGVDVLEPADLRRQRFRARRAAPPRPTFFALPKNRMRRILCCAA